MSKKSGRSTTKNNAKVNTESITTDFGTRNIVGQNFSKMVSIPKVALANLETKASSMKIELVQEKNGEKFLKLSPARKGGKRS